MIFSAPISLSFSLTESCNLSCSHCAVSAKSDNEVMQEKYIDKILNYCIENKVRVLEITGGEPLLFPATLIKIGNQVKTQNIVWGVTTNGLLLNTKIIVELKKAGIYAIKVSLEGPKEYNDSIRGKGSFDLAIKGIKKCVKQGLPVAVLTTLSRKNIGLMDKFVDLLDVLGVNLVIFFPMMPLGRAKNLENFLLEKNDFEKFLSFLASKKTRHLRINIEMPELANKPNSKNLAKGCPIGYSFHVCYNGDVWPCPVFPLVLGNIKKEPLTKIWKNDFFKEIKNSDNLKGACAKCVLKETCNGGCRAMSYLVKGSYFEQDPYCKKFGGTKECII